MKKINLYQFEIRQQSPECYKVTYLTQSGEDLYVSYVGMSPMLGAVIFPKDPTEKNLHKLRRYVMRTGIRYSSSKDSE